MKETTLELVEMWNNSMKGTTRSYILEKLIKGRTGLWISDFDDQTEFWEEVDKRI